MPRTVATKSRTLIRCLTILVVAVLSASAQPAGASNYTLKKLYSFCAQTGCPDAAPYYSGLVMGKGGVLYGVANAGGATGNGVVYALTPKSGKYNFSTVYDFCQSANCTDGATPVGDLILDVDGSLYGTTYEGGTHDDNGVIFRLSKSGGTWTYKVLRNLCAQSTCKDGGNASAGLSYQGANVGRVMGQAVAAVRRHRQWWNEWQRRDLQIPAERIELELHRDSQSDHWFPAQHGARRRGWKSVCLRCAGRQIQCGRAVSA